MKSILYPLIIGLLIGILAALGILWMEFGGVEESFLNYKPE